MRRYPDFLRRAAILGLAAGAAACSGNNSSNSATSPQNAYGVWSGTDSSSGLGLIGIVNTNDTAVFIRADGVVYADTNTGQPTISVLQAALSGQMHGFSPIGGSFGDGYTFGIGTLGGNVTTGKTLVATWSFTTVDNPTNANSTSGSTTTTQWSLNFESAYSGAPTLSAIAGNYTDTTTSPGDPSEGSTVSISASGAITAQAATTGCVLNGQATPDDTQNQIFKFTYSYASCTGSYAVLNGIQFSGIGAFNPTKPATIVLGVAGQAPSPKLTSYGLTLSLSQT